MAKRRRNPPLELIVPNPPAIGREVHYLGYEHADDGLSYRHDFGPGSVLEGHKDGSIRIWNPDARLWDDLSVGRYLVNPPARRRQKKGARSMAKRTPPRNKDGTFRKRARASTKRRRNPPANPPGKRRARARPAAARARSSARSSRSSSRRRNPPRYTVRRAIKDLTEGTQNAGLVLLGKAGARTVPTMVPGIPREGNLGLGVQALTALGLGLVASRVFKPERAKMVLAGALSAPVETLILTYRVPWLSNALSPTTVQSQVSAYVQPSRLPNGNGGGRVARYVEAGSMGRYVPANVGLAGYVEDYDEAAHGMM